MPTSGGHKLRLRGSRLGAKSLTPETAHRAEWGGRSPWKQELWDYLRGCGIWQWKSGPMGLAIGGIDLVCQSF